MKRSDVLKRAARLCAMVGATILMSACAGTMASGVDAGCRSYSEARLAMPDQPVPPGAWGGWIADTDDRMTGACT